MGKGGGFSQCKAARPGKRTLEKIQDGGKVEEGGEDRE